MSLDGTFVRRNLLKSLEQVSRYDQDVLIGAVLLQVKAFLFAEDQETEEGGGGLRTCDAIT